MIAELVAPEKPKTEIKMVHYEKLPGLSYCGTTLSGPYLPAETEADCVVCAELWESEWLV